MRPIHNGLPVRRSSELGRRQRVDKEVDAAEQCMYTLCMAGRSVVEFSARALRCIGLPLLVLGLMAATVIDADGDVTTTNLPSIVLVSSRDLHAVDDAEIDTLDPDAPTYEEKSAVLVRRLRRLSASLGITGRLHHAVRSIRGP